MREIKFRAWDWKKMLPSYDFLSICLNLFSWTWIDWREITFLQYTWLKDKNWKEIYEGDVVEYPQNFDNSAFWLMCPKSSGEIKYIDEYAQFNISWYFWGEDFYKNTQMIEVIWNVYENPELLEFNS